MCVCTFVCTHLCVYARMRVCTYSATDGKIKSAKEMGLAAESAGIIKKKKTHKGRKILESRESKTVENNKSSILVKGNKTSLMITETLTTHTKTRTPHT